MPRKSPRHLCLSGLFQLHVPLVEVLLEQSQVAVVDLAVSGDVGGILVDGHAPLVEVLLEGSQVAVVDLAVVVDVAGGVGRHLTDGTAEVAIGVAVIVVLVLAIAVGAGEVVGGAAGAFIQGIGAAHVGILGVAGKGVDRRIKAEQGVDTGSLVAHVGEFVAGGLDGGVPFGIVGHLSDQRGLVAGFVSGAGGIGAGAQVLHGPGGTVLGDVPHHRVVGYDDVAARDGDLHVLQTGLVGHSTVHSLAVKDDQIVAGGEFATVGLKDVAQGAAVHLGAGEEGIEDGVPTDGILAAGGIVGGHRHGGGNLGLCPAHEGGAVGGQIPRPVGQSHVVAAVGGEGIVHVAVVHQRQGHLRTGPKLDADAHVGGGVDGEGVAVAHHVGIAAEDGVAGDGIAVGRVGGHGLAADRHGAVGGVGGGGGDVVGTGGTLTRGGLIILGDLGTEHHEDQFGIVHEHVAGAGDGLNGVVAAQLPGVHGVLLHPLQQHVTALHHTGGAPHFGGVAPTAVDVQHDAGHVAAQIVLAAGFGVGVVVAAALAVGLVTAGGVFAGGGGAQHHDVVFGIAVALTVGPGVLAVPAAVPGGADGLAGVEGGDLTAAVLTVGVAVQIFGLAVVGDVLVVGAHQTLQLLVQGAGGHTAHRGGAAQQGQLLVGGVVLVVPFFGVGGHKGGHLFAGAPVVDVLAGIDVVHRGRLSGQNDETAEQADEQNERGQPRQRTLVQVFHSGISFALILFAHNIHTSIILHILTGYNRQSARKNEGCS